MQARELRIGNLVDLGNRIARIIEIAHLGCVVVDLEETQDTIEDYERTKPIPLTEEWLLKFGFELTEIGWEHWNFDILFYKDLSNGYFESNQLPMFIYLQYVHQLQNLYFALTGFELELKL